MEQSKNLVRIFEYALNQEETGKSFFQISIQRMGMGAGGTFETKFARFKTIEIAGFTVNDPIISYPLEEGVGAFRAADITGNLGNTLFRHFVMYFDYKDQKMIIEKGDNFAHEFPVDKSGLQMIVTDDDNIAVFFVAPGTPEPVATMTSMISPLIVRP